MTDGTLDVKFFSCPIGAMDCFGWQTNSMVIHSFYETKYMHCYINTVDGKIRIQQHFFIIALKFYSNVFKYI
jgi:hypothetical protein